MQFNLVIRRWWNPELALAAVRAAGARGALELAEYVADEARRLCPVRSGKLKASIQVVSSSDLLEHYVIATMPYAEPVEFGYTHWITKKRVPPVAYLRRALRLGEAKFPEIIRPDMMVRQGFHRGAVMGVQITAA